VAFDTDHRFQRVAELVWPEDMRLATSYVPRRGRAAARATMQARYEGWQAIRTLSRLAEEVSGIVAEATGVRRG